MQTKIYIATHRKAHVSELFDETIHDPSLIWLVDNLPLKIHEQNIKKKYFLNDNNSHQPVCVRVRCVF